MKVIDSIVPTAYQDALEEVFLTNKCAWYLRKDLYESGLPNEENITRECAVRFAHTIFFNNEITSDFYPMVSEILRQLMLVENIRTDRLLRIKANLDTQTSLANSDQHFIKHVDFTADSDFITCIYYVNDSDGDTVLFDPITKQELYRVSPKKGRLIFFDGKTPHAGYPPVVSKTRCLLNFNFYKEAK